MNKPMSAIARDSVCFKFNFRHPNKAKIGRYNIPAGCDSHIMVIDKKSNEGSRFESKTIH